MSESKRFYVTTPIYYPNGEPHLGHVYTTICADVLARYHRAAGDDTYFLTGTDEHGIKMVKTAEQEKTTPLDLATKNSNVFRKTFREFNISNDDFIRTSEDRHKQAVTEIVRRMVESGDIYLGHYEGWYDEGQEEFITETEAKDAEYKSKISGRPLVRYKEPTYFFKLTKYAKQVYDLIESDQLKVRPAIRKNEILSKLKGWDQDLSISRASLTWGIPLPNDPKHVVYVWIDALSNYITALGFAGDDESKYQKFWPASVHLIGKEILWFHAFYWPAMLLSLGQPLPEVLFAHGWWTSEGKKMSKSMGNFIDLPRLRELSAKYSQDTLRFYLLRAAPFGNDLDFSEGELHNASLELSNVLGNLLNRSLKMTAKYREGHLPAVGASGPEDAALNEVLSTFGMQLKSAYDNVELQRCVQLPIELARAANVYIDQTKPFSLAKHPAQAARLETVLNLATRAAYAALVGLIPVLPEKAKAGLAQLGVNIEGKTIAQLLADSLPAGQKLSEGEPLFPRIEAAK
ncbi:MAG: methionine--tRNA ligase [Tepidisphaeraceae bacterium]